MEEITQLSEATSLEDFKTLRQAQREATAPVAEKPAQSEEDTPAPSAAEAGTAEAKAQETPAAEKSVDDQIKELRAKGKHAAANKLMADEAARPHREETEKLRKELEGLRTRPAEAKTEPAKAASTEDPEPKPSDEKYTGANGYEQYMRDCGRWDRRQEARAEKIQSAKDKKDEETKTKWGAAKIKYADLETVTEGLVPKLTEAMKTFVIDHPQGIDVLYRLGGDEAERVRISSLSPTMQIAELGYLGKLIVTPAANVPEKKLTPAVSRVAPSPRVLNGVDTPEPKSTAEATSFEEFKQLRRRRA